MFGYFRGCRWWLGIFCSCFLLLIIAILFLQVRKHSKILQYFQNISIFIIYASIFLIQYFQYIILTQQPFFLMIQFPNIISKKYFLKYTYPYIPSIYNINVMKISSNKKQFQISFDSNNQINNLLDREQEKDIIDKFVQPCPYFQFPHKNNQDIEKFKKKVIGSANQYGTRNQKTTAIFLSLLQVTREIATSQLKKKEYLNACCYYTMCLGLVDPDDQIFLQKFIITKIDIANKLMFCLFQMKTQKNQNKYLQAALLFLEQFVSKIKTYAFQQTLIKSDICMVELNYFYLGRTYRKRKNYEKAITAFLKAQQIISEKIKQNTYQKNPALQQFCQNLQIKTFYKISKCCREKDSELQQIYEGRALQLAQKNNNSLYQYINKKIRMYKSAKLFNEKLSKLQGKKKIQDQFLKYIEEINQRQYSSLYDVYKDRPNNYSSTDIMFKQCTNY